MIYGRIYKIVNKVNGKLYVGQTIYDLEKRFREHKHASLTKKTYLYNAINKYGFENFTIDEIDKASSLEELNNKEIYWINKLNTLMPNGYNMVKGGNGVKGYKHTKKTKLLLKNKSKGNTNAKGKHNISLSSKDKMIKAHKGKQSKFKNKHHTLEAKNKISIKHCKPVMCIETNKIYSSSLEASKELNITNHIGNCCNGKRKTCNGFHFKWV